MAHWSRANGWIFMATADLLARMPKNHPMREDVIKNFQMQASGVARYQGKKMCIRDRTGIGELILSIAFAFTGRGDFVCPNYIE